MIHEFGEFRLDVARRELRRSGEEIAVEPQVFSLLAHLIENRDRVVGKDELIETVWEGRIVSDATLNTRINAARRAVGDSGKEQAFIRTLPRRGFRFVGEMSAPAPDGATAVPAAAQLRHEQTVRFCTAPDGVRIAYATSGDGPPLVKAPNWLNHLEHDWESPVWGHLFRELSRGHTLLRFDQRGNGLSDWDVPEFTFDGMIDDLATVADAAGFDRFPLFGISQGCAHSIAYAHRHPDRVSRLILYGGFALGQSLRGPKDKGDAHWSRQMIREGWGQNNPAFRQFFTSLFMPGASKAQMDWFNEMQRLTTSPDNAADIYAVANYLDVRPLLSEIKVPTLVIHCKDDAGVAFDLGREMAAGIPDARFVALDGRNHLILEDEPAWPRFVQVVNDFLAEGETAGTATKRG